MQHNNADLEILFRSKIEVDQETGCWHWKGALRPNGYGRFVVNRVGVYAHRWAYEHFTGPIPEDMVIDHLCRVRKCVNPDHLECVTSPENTRRSEAATSGHCKRGHRYTPENTRITADGRRKCKECDKLTKRQRYAPYGGQPKTHCPQGHPYDETNTGIDKLGKRYCILCSRLRSAKSYQNRKTGILPQVRTCCAHGHPYTEGSFYLNSKGSRICRECQNTNRQRATHAYRQKNQRVLQRYTSQQWEDLKARYNYICLSCGRKEPEITLTADHVIPTSQGGSDLIENIQPLCGSCNSSKGAKIVDYRV